MLLPGFLEQRVLFTLELFEVVLEKESPNGEFDDQLRDAFNERFEGGNVPHVVIPLALPVRSVHEELVRNAKVEILRPTLVRTNGQFCALFCGGKRNKRWLS